MYFLLRVKVSDFHHSGNMQFLTRNRRPMCSGQVKGDISFSEASLQKLPKTKTLVYLSLGRHEHNHLNIENLYINANRTNSQNKNPKSGPALN